MKTFWRIAQQIGAPILGAGLPTIAQGHVPATLHDWVVFLAGAVIASGLLNATAPRNQGALVVQQAPKP